MDIEEVIEKLQIELQKKTLDLQMAAQIGQELVAQNGKLKEEMGLLTDQLNQRCSSHDLINLKSKLDVLEASYSDLLGELENKEGQNHQLQESVRSHTELSKKFEEEASTYRFEVGELQDLLKDSDDSKTKLEQDVSDKCKVIDDLEDKLGKAHESLKDHFSKLEESDRRVQEMAKTSEQVQAANEKLSLENSALSVKLQEVESLLESYQEFRQQSQEQENTIETLNLELEFLRDANQKLTSKLSAVGSSSVCSSGGQDSMVGDMGEKSLLHEIEERRLQLIRDNEKLAQKHAGLTQSHNLSLYRQQKMKHHIARLSQLTSGDVSQEKVRLLEEELAQCQSEKLELEKRVDALQLKRYAPSQWDEPEIPFGSHISSLDTQRLESLEFRIQQLMDESDSLKKMNQTLRVVKAAESDKLHQTTSALLERERELDAAKRELANTKFELDELLLGVQEGKLFSGKDENIPDPVPDSSETAVDSKKQVDVREDLENNRNFGNLKEAPPRQSFDKSKRSAFKTIKVDKAQVDQQCNQQ